MKYATQNMPNIVSLENGNEAAVRHKRTCSTICVPNSPCSETGVFKNTLRKVMSSVTVSVGLACVASVSARIVEKVGTRAITRLETLATQATVGCVWADGYSERKTPAWWVSRNISHMRCSVSSPDETSRRELKIDAQRSIFDELRGVSSGDETLCRMFDISSQTKSFLKEKLRMQILSIVSSDFQTLIKH